MPICRTSILIPAFRQVKNRFNRSPDINTMKLGSCPKCGSRRVRTGRIYLLHLARLALNYLKDEGNFASEQDAKAAYGDFQRHRGGLPK